MASPIFQKLFVLVLGSPADTSFAPALEDRVSHEGWASTIADINAYLDAQGDARGTAVVLQEMAMNGLGYELSDAEAAAIAHNIDTGATTWADLLAWVILELQGPLADTLDNRAEAAEAFTAALVEQDKEGLYVWNSGANLHGAAQNLLHSIGADDLTFEQGMDSLVALVDSLSAEGQGGVVSDGRLSGATVFIDANGNGLLDAGETVDTTDAAGNYDVPPDAHAGSLMMMGGTDILAVTEFIGVLQAPAGATVITALTSLAEAMLDIDAQDTALGASAATTAALGLPPINVLNYDPIVVLADPEASAEDYAQALAVERASIQLMTLVSHLTVALMGDGMEEDEAAQAAWAAVAGAAANGTLDLTDADAIAELFGDAGVDDADGMAQVVAELNTAAEDADGIVELARVAVVSGDSSHALQDALDEGDGLDGFVDEYTGENLQEKIDGADPGFLLPGVPVDGDSGPNLPPSGSDATVVADEDTAFAFSGEDFGYSDVNGDDMAAVRIDTLPSAGTLMLDGEAVTAGQVVAAEDLSMLTFMGAADANGTGYADFTFSVQDDEGAFDTAARTMTIDVAPVNDLPTGTVWLVGLPWPGNKIFAMNDLADIEGMGDVRYEWFLDGESLGVFGSQLTIGDNWNGRMITAVASYTDGGGTLESVTSGEVRAGFPNHVPTGSVTITGDATQGETLTALNGVSDEDGLGEISWQWFADGIEIEGATGEDLVLTQDQVGKEITVQMSYVDGLGNAEAVEGGPTDEVANVNDAPTLSMVADFSGTEDVGTVITYADLLGNSDAEDIDIDDEILFEIKSIEDGTTLTIFDGEDTYAAEVGDVIRPGYSVTWTAAENANGEDMPAFTVQAWDEEAYSGEDVLVSVDVTPVNDAPTLTDMAVIVDTDEETPREITYADLLASAQDEADVEDDASDELTFRITSVVSGMLEKWDGEDWVAAGEDTTVSFGEKLQWTPALNAFGTDVDAFRVVVVDTDGAASSPSVLVEVEVDGVNDAPTLTTMDTLSGGSEDDPYYFNGEDLFAAGNENDVDGDTLGFIVKSVGEDSSLAMWDGDSWEPAGNGTVIWANSELRWIPPAEGNGVFGAFTVVIADTGTESTPAITVNIDVAAGQAPVLDNSASPALTTVAETVGSLTPSAPTNGSTTGATQVSSLASETGIANVTDADDNTIGIAITAFNASSQGKLWYSTNGGTTWTEVGSPSAAAALLLDNNDYVFFKPNAEINGSISSVFTFKAWDLSGGSSGGTANTTAGDSWSSATDTVSVSITAAPAQNPVNDGSTFGDGIDDLFYGGGGNDTLTSGTGSDTLYGGGGDDVITSENGSDLIDGGSGNDILNAGNDGDTVVGGTGNDSITGGNAADVIRGGAGNDTIDGGNQGDTIQFEATAAANGVDRVTFSPGNNQDVLALPNVMATQGVESDGGTFAASIAEFDSGDSANTALAGKVALYAGAALTGVNEASEVAALFQGSAIELAANGKAILITGTTSDSEAYVWYVVNDATGTVIDTEVTLVAVLLTGSGVDAFHATNFTFYTA